MSGQYPLRQRYLRDIPTSAEQKRSVHFAYFTADSHLEFLTERPHTNLGSTQGDHIIAWAFILEFTRRIFSRIHFCHYKAS